MSLLFFVLLSVFQIHADSPPSRCELFLEGPADRAVESTAYELKVAEHYLDWHRAPGEKIVIASQIMGWYVPAFDGVVMDEHGAKIANLSIKGIRVASPDNEHVIPPRRVAFKMHELLRHAYKMTKDWSEEARWKTAFKYSREELAAVEVLSKNNAHKKAFLDTAMDLFSIPFSRTRVKTRIVVAVTDRAGDLEELDQVQLPRKTIHRILNDEGGPVESITILTKNRVWDFRREL